MTYPVPDFDGEVGEQFAIGTPNSTLNDTTCDLANRQAPRLSFQAHTAPLDILFNEMGTAAWITFHGSWNRDSPIGYELSVVEFANGEPLAANTSREAAVPIMSNQGKNQHSMGDFHLEANKSSSDLSACPDGCFRPVGLAWDPNGRLFMSSDATGEVYMIVRADGNATAMAGSNATGSIPGDSTSTGSAPESSTSTSTASFVSASVTAIFFAVFAFVL